MYVYVLIISYGHQFPIVYEQNRGWSVGVSGLAFLGVLVGFLSGVAYYIFYEVCPLSFTPPHHFPY